MLDENQTTDLRAVSAHEALVRLAGQPEALGGCTTNAYVWLQEGVRSAEFRSGMLSGDVKRASCGFGPGDVCDLAYDVIVSVCAEPVGDVALCIAAVQHGFRHAPVRDDVWLNAPCRHAGAWLWVVPKQAADLEAAAADGVQTVELVGDITFEQLELAAKVWDPLGADGPSTLAEAIALGRAVSF